MSPLSLRIADIFLFLGPLDTWESHILGRIQTFDLDSRDMPFGTVYYCSVCGRAWGGRIPCSGPRQWIYHDRDCQQHGDGSLLLRTDIWDSIPDSIAQYEISVFNPNIYSRFHK